MNNGSIFGRREMTFEADMVIQSFAILERFVAVAGALLPASRRAVGGFGASPLRVAQA